MKVALVYDRVNKWGGAERILLALHELFPNAPLFTSVYDQRRAGWAEGFQVKTSFLQKIKPLRSRHEFLAGIMPIVFESFDFSNFDLVISITSESAKGVITKPPTQHICICLTPTRYLWSGYDDYFKSKVFKVLAYPLVKYLRVWDKIAAHRPDVYIAISQTVVNRIERYYGRQSQVLYPPILKSLERIIDKKSSICKIDQPPFFLTVSRLSRHTSYKRVDLAVKSAKKAGVKLIVIGDGKDKDFFKKMADDSVVFLGNVDDETLVAYYKCAQALVFPGKEDFGLVMAEAQRAGTPVIAYRAGGAREIVKEGVTGEFFDKQSIASLTSVLKSFKKSRYNTNNCVKNGKRFSQDIFDKQLLSCINKYL